MEVTACGAGESGSCVYLKRLREELEEPLEVMAEELKRMEKFEAVFQCSCGCADAIAAGGYAGAGCLNCENDQLKQKLTFEDAKLRYNLEFKALERKLETFTYLVEQLESEMDSAQREQIITPHIPTTLEMVLRKLYKLAKPEGG